MFTDFQLVVIIAGIIYLLSILFVIRDFRAMEKYLYE